MGVIMTSAPPEFGGLPASAVEVEQTDLSGARTVRAR